MYLLPNYIDPAQAADASLYKGAIDESASVHDAIAGAFYVYEAATPDMTVVINGGLIQEGVALTSVAQQTTTAFNAPTSGTDIHRVFIDTSTGTYGSVLTPDTVPLGKIVLADISIATGTTAITNSMITDRRPAYFQTNAEGQLITATYADAVGVNIDVTGINSGVKRIAISVDNLDTTVGDYINAYLGDSGGPETGGYDVTSYYMSGTSNDLLASGVIKIMNASFPTIGPKIYGTLFLTSLNDTGKLWAISGSFRSGNNDIVTIAGTKALSGVLDRIRFQCSTAWASGSISIVTSY